MQRELRLDEDVGGCPLPGQALADQLPVFTVEEQACGTDPGRAMIFAGVKELHAVHTESCREENAARWLRPLATLCFGLCLLGDLGKADARLLRMQRVAWRARVKRCWRDLRDGGHQWIKHFTVEIQRKRREGQDEEQYPCPQVE